MPYFIPDEKGTDTSGRIITVLSIDGGGIRGIIPARVIARIERETGKRIHELFDVVAGTSTGGILALGLTKPDPKTGDEMLDFYRKEGENIFFREKRDWKSKVLQHVSGLILVGTSLYLSTRYLGMKIPFSLRSLQDIKLTEALSLFGKGLVMVGSWGGMVHLGLNPNNWKGITGGFLRGGGLGGLVSLLLSVNGNRNHVPSFGLLGTCYGFGMGFAHGWMKSRSLRHYTWKQALRDMPVAGVAGLVLGYSGTNIRFEQAIQRGLIGGACMLPTTYLFSKLLPTLFPEYTRAGIDGILKRNFSVQQNGQSVDYKLSEAKTEILITSYQTNARKPVLFTKKTHGDYKMVDVAGATSAAPTYFPPKKIDRDGQNDGGTYIDGGLIANNPTLCAYVHAYVYAKEKFKDSNYKFFIVSLGTGENKKLLPYNEIASRGTIGWLRDIIGIQGESAITHILMEDLLSDDWYFRIQISLPEEIALDEASPQNIERLENCYESKIEDSRIRKVVTKLRSFSIFPAESSTLPESFCANQTNKISCGR